MRVIVAAGGSGGHIFPAIALASSLRHKGVSDIYFVSSKKKLDVSLLKDTENKCFFLSVNPLPLKFSIGKVVIFICKLIIDAVKSVFILIKIRPKVVVGFGGYSQGAIIRVASLFKIPIIIHEQNLTPGRANKILSKCANKIAISFRGTEKYFPKMEEKIILTGNPIRLEMLSKDKVKSCHKLGISDDIFTILIMGGSQGSAFLNKTASMGVQIAAEMLNVKMQIIHLTGRSEFEIVKGYYDTNKVVAKVFPFLERIDDAYAACDFVISRSGAAAIFEVAYYSKPMILIPYPNPKNSQRDNAKYFSEKGAAVCVEEMEIDAQKLAREVFAIISNTDKIKSMSEASSSLAKPEAADLLADEVIKIMEIIE